MEKQKKTVKDKAVAVDDSTNRIALISRGEEASHMLPIHIPTHAESKKLHN
jgi:hypothetical protein